MPLKLYKRPNGIYHIRGVVQGRRFDESARTRKPDEAEQIRAKLEADAFKRAVYGDDAVATFAEAAEGYMLAGGDGTHLAALLLRIGHKRLRDVTQGDLDKLAAERPNAKPATLLRQIYTPATAVMTFAASPAGGKLCAKPEFKKPSVKNARTAFLTPSEVEAWLGALPDHLRPLVTFYVGTGCRATEALGLRWRDVSPELERVTFWETKEDYARGVQLPRRVRALMPARRGRDDFVFLNSDGDPWHAYDAINTALKRIRQPQQRKSVKRPQARREARPDLAPAHCHLFRHTWATWAYACTRDLTFLMQSGGWRSLAMVQRYTHVGSADLATAVIAAGWEFGGRELPGLKPKRRKAQ